MSGIHSIADAFGDASGGLAAWRPEDPGDLVDSLDAVTDMIHDFAVGLARYADHLGETGLHPGVTDMARAAAFAVARAESYAGEMRRIAGM